MSIIRNVYIVWYICIEEGIYGILPGAEITHELMRAYMTSNYECSAVCYMVNYKVFPFLKFFNIFKFVYQIIQVTCKNTPT